MDNLTKRGRYKVEDDEDGWWIMDSSNSFYSVNNESIRSFDEAMRQAQDHEDEMVDGEGGDE